MKIAPPVAALLAVSLAFSAAAQSVHPVTGRRIAPVMSPGEADWLNRSQRQSEENTDRALKDLDLKPGMIVADIGAGTGYFSIRIAERVLPGGKVLAVDIQPEMLRRLRANAAAERVSNIEPILAAPSDPKLPPAAVDLAILVDVYHELSEPQTELRHLRDALKPDGQLVLLEYRKEDASVPIRPEHKMSLAEVKAEVQPEGFVFQKAVETLPWQHMIFFKPAAAH